MITMAENLLEECRLHAAEAEEQVRAQTQRIAELRSAGEDTEEAERLLRSLEQMAALLRDRVAWEESCANADATVR